jgi:hypothetical protein
MQRSKLAVLLQLILLCGIQRAIEAINVFLLSMGLCP